MVRVASKQNCPELPHHLLYLFSGDTEAFPNKPRETIFYPRYSLEKALSCLHPQSYYFGHYPQLLTVRVGRKVDQPVNGQLRSLFATTDRYNMCITAHGAPICLSCSLLHSSCSILPPSLDVHLWGKFTFSRHEPWRVLTQITSHLASNRPSASWRSALQHSNCKKSGAHHTGHPTPLDCTKKMLSIKVMNSIFDKGQNWHNLH